MQQNNESNAERLAFLSFADYLEAGAERMESSPAYADDIKAARAKRAKAAEIRDVQLGIDTAKSPEVRENLIEQRRRMLAGAEAKSKPKPVKWSSAGQVPKGNRKMMRKEFPGSRRSLPWWPVLAALVALLVGMGLGLTVGQQDGSSDTDRLAGATSVEIDTPRKAAAEPELVEVPTIPAACLDAADAGGQIITEHHAYADAVTYGLQAAAAGDTTAASEAKMLMDDSRATMNNLEAMFNKARQGCAE